jgi:hypothetical protein
VPSEVICSGDTHDIDLPASEVRTAASAREFGRNLAKHPTSRNLRLDLSRSRNPASLRSRASGKPSSRHSLVCLIFFAETGQAPCCWRRRRVAMK